MVYLINILFYFDNFIKPGSAYEKSLKNYLLPPYIYISKSVVSSLFLILIIIFESLTLLLSFITAIYSSNVFY